VWEEKENFGFSARPTWLRAYWKDTSSRIIFVKDYCGIATVVALSLEGILCKRFWGAFPMWSTQKISGPFHVKML